MSSGVFSLPESVMALQLLSETRTGDGWPKWIDDDGKSFAIQAVRAGLEKRGHLNLDLAQKCIFEGDEPDELPDCLRGLIWMWRIAVTYRTLEALGAFQVFMIKPDPVKAVKDAA